MRTPRIVKSMSSASSHWMPNSYGFYRKAEDVEVRFYGMVNAHIASEKHRAINFFISKIKERKKKKKEIKKNQPTPGVDHGTLERQRCAVPLGYVNIRCRTQKNKHLY